MQKRQYGLVHVEGILSRHPGEWAKCSIGMWGRQAKGFDSVRDLAYHQLHCRIPIRIPSIMRSYWLGAI